MSRPSRPQRCGAKGLSPLTSKFQELRDALDPAKAPGPVRTLKQMSPAEREEILKSLERV